MFDVMWYLGLNLELWACQANALPTELYPCSECFVCMDGWVPSVASGVLECGADGCESPCGVCYDLNSGKSNKRSQMHLSVLWNTVRTGRAHTH